MSIGITQLILLVVVAVILFGNIPKLFKDVSVGILTVKQSLSKSNKDQLLSAKQNEAVSKNPEEIARDPKETSSSDHTNNNSKT